MHDQHRDAPLKQIPAGIWILGSGEQWNMEPT